MKTIKPAILILILLSMYVSITAFPAWISAQDRKLTPEEKFKTYTPVAIDESKVYGPKEGKKIKVFILSGQSNMVGQGASYQLDNFFQQGSERVLMFEKGKWQPLRPLKKSFGPEISFAHAVVKTWPGETIGIVKFLN